MTNDQIKDEIIKKCTVYYDMGILNRIISKPEVYDTNELCIPDKELNYTNGIAIGPFVVDHLFTLFIFVLPVALGVNHFLEKDVIGYPFIALYIVLYGIAYFIYRFITPFHREIKISRNYISLKEGKFLWKDIYGTYILINRGGYRSPTTSFLILVDYNSNMVKHEISYISCTREMLATIIEYFKNNSNSQRIINSNPNSSG